MDDNKEILTLLHEIRADQSIVRNEVSNLAERITMIESRVATVEASTQFRPPPMRDRYSSLEEIAQTAGLSTSIRAMAQETSDQTPKIERGIGLTTEMRRELRFYASLIMTLLLAIIGLAGTWMSTHPQISLPVSQHQPQ